MKNQVLANILRAPQVFFAKQTVLRLQAPFAIDLEKYSEADYEKIIPSLKDIERRLLALPADRQGMRWIHEDATVLFYGERTFDVPYDDFISRVDIGHVGEFYRDSLSVTTIVVKRDDHGRSTCQGVRVVALPQPNYAAFLGKGNLDVYKLEKVDYSEDERRVWMLTVHSPNGSAVCDDGYMSFKRSSDGKGTVVAFLACQNFPFPPLMKLTGMHRWTWLKNRLTESAYRNFCNTMMKNILDAYHGHEFHVGRPVSKAAAAV